MRAADGWQRRAAHAVDYSCFDASRKSTPVADYVKLVFDEVADGDRQNLFNINEDDFVGSNSIISIARNLASNLTISGCHAAVDGQRVITCKGVVTRPPYRRLGIGRRVFANAIVKSVAIFNSSSFGLVVRRHSDGPAPEAFAMYESFGFEVIRYQEVKISGSHCDRHLRGEAGNADRFNVVVMAGDFRTLKIAAQHCTLNGENPA